MLRGFELQLGRTAARLVLGDAGGLFDQLAPIGRARAQDHPDLALLDDGVGLLPEARVHQQFVDVLQPARLAIDQVFTFARSKQPAGDLDLAGRRFDELGMVAIAVGVMSRGVLAHLLQQGWRDNDVAEAKTDFGGPGGLARIGTVEDDVFHLVAAEALGALLAEHPRQRIGHVGLTAAVGSDNGGDTTVECQLGPIREGLET